MLGRFPIPWGALRECKPPRSPSHTPECEADRPRLPLETAQVWEAKPPFFRAAMWPRGPAERELWSQGEEAFLSGKCVTAKETPKATKSEDRVAEN